MWINPDTLETYRTHTEIRSAWPKTLFPSVMPEETIASLGLLLVLPTPLPGFDPALQIAEEAAPALIDGQWTQQWTVRDLPPEERKARVPTVVSMRQARLALLQAGLLDQVDAAIAGIAEESQRRQAEINWEYATTVERLDGWVRQIGVGLGLSEADLDGLFERAMML